MNVRTEFRQAFRQYRRRLGLPLACPTSDVRVGDLCYFNVDGTVGTLANVLDGTDEKCVTTTVDESIDPIISNGMRCRTLSSEDLGGYEFNAYGVDEAYRLSREKFNISDYAILPPCLIKTEISYSVTMRWINQNAQAIRTLLNDYNVDPEYGLILVLTQYSAPSYTRVVVPSNLAEQGVVLGLSNGERWVEPDGAPRTLTMIDHFENKADSTLFVNGLSIRKASVTRRVRDTLGFNHYSGDRQWKKTLKVKRIAQGNIASLCHFD